MKNICDWNNCNKIGEYKAPVEKDNSKKFRLLCLNHVKEFNKNWNYFSGMNDDQVIDFLKSDMVWHKPTQSFSSSDNFFKVLWSNTLRDDLDKEKLKSDFNHMGQFRYNHKDIKAFEILGISVGSKWEKIYNKFKGRKKIIGICLGYQQILHCENAKIIQQRRIFHGYQSEVKVVSNKSIFRKNSKFKVGRYHSLKLQEPFIKENFDITMRCAKTNIAMAFENKRDDVYGFQFHPESFLTTNGKILIKKILQSKRS